MIIDTSTQASHKVDDYLKRIRIENENQKLDVLSDDIRPMGREASEMGNIHLYRYRYKWQGQIKKTQKS